MLKFNNVEELVHFIESRRRVTPKNDLSKMEYYLRHFNDPHLNLPVIHITGTNGKGSTVAFLNSIFRKHHLNVGCFTSPYITCFNERIRYNDCNISDEELLSIGNEIISNFDKWEKEGIELPSFFEFVTLICFIYFGKIKDLDVVLLEVGIGGRLDSTNVVNSLISIITSISYDHMSILGNSLQEILIEKLGIVKQNNVLFANIKEPELISICNDYCNNKNSICNIIDHKNIKVINSSLNGSEFEYDNNKFSINMIGLHQIENAVLAYEVAKYYFKEIRKDLSISNVLLNEGLKNTSWIGRLEIINNNPFIIVDGAHNEDGIKRICDFIKTLNIDISEKRGIVAVSDNKDKASMVKLLDETFGELIFTKFNYSRSTTSNALYSLSNNGNKLIIEDLNDIKNYIFNNPKQFNIFIGSLYFVSEVKKFFNH